MQDIAAAFLESAEGRQEIRFFADLPEPALAAMLDYWWDRDRLFTVTAALPAEEVLVRDYAWLLDVAFRPGAGSMNDLRRKPLDAPEWRRTLDADSTYPIVLAEKGHRWVVLDGYHRLLKADVQGMSTIRAVRLPQHRVPEILVHSGFRGALNRLRRPGRDLLPEVKMVAQLLIRQGTAEE